MASASSIRAARAFVELFADTSKLQQDLRQAENMLKEFSTRATTLGRTVTAAGGIMIAPIAASIKTFYQFDDNMREVQAVTQATGKEFDMLSEKAKKLGRETSFTAIQVSQAMATLGRAGFRSKEIDDSISSILSLARATRTDLNEAARIASLSMRGFTLDASEMTRVADVLSVVSNGAALNLVDFGESMKYVAPVAHQAGMSIEDAAGAIGVLSNFGIKGTMAGTALKNILTRMANTEVAAKFKQIGVETKDAQGNLRALIDVLYDVAKATQYMGSGDRMEIFKGLADLRALPSFAVMANNPEKIVEMIDELRVSMGKAAEMSALMDAGLGGAFRMFISAVESASISLAEAVTGPLQAYMESIKKGVNNFNAWIKTHGQTIRLYAKSALLLIGLGGAMYGVGKAAQILSSSLAMIRGALSGVSAGIKVVTDSLMNFSGVGKLLAAQQRAVQGEIAAQKELGRAQNAVNRAIISRQHWQNVLSKATEGTKQYTYAENKLADATDRELWLKENLTRAEKEYTVAAAAAAKAKKAADGGGAWAVMKGTYHRLGGNITDQTNWFAGKRVGRDVLAMLSAVKSVGVQVGKGLLNVLQAPFVAMRSLISSTAQMFSTMWGASIKSVRFSFAGLQRVFSRQFLTDAFSGLGNAINSLKIKGLKATIRSIGLAAKTAAVGVGLLKASFMALTKATASVVLILGAAKMIKGINKMISAEVKLVKTAEQATEKWKEEQKEIERAFDVLKKLSEASKNGPLSDKAFAFGKQLVDELSKSVGDLGVTYDQTKRKIEMTGDAQEAFNKKMKETSISKLQDQLREAEENRRKVIDKRNRLNELDRGYKGGSATTTAGVFWNSLSASATDWDQFKYGIGRLWMGIQDWFNDEELGTAAKKQWDELNAVLKDCNSSIDEITTAIERLNNTSHDAADGFVDAAQHIAEMTDQLAAKPFKDISMKPGDVMKEVLGVVDTMKSPAERIREIQDNSQKQWRTLNNEYWNYLGKNTIRTDFNDPEMAALAKGIVLPIDAAKNDIQDYRKYLEGTRRGIENYMVRQGKLFESGEITKEVYDQRMLEAADVNNALPELENQYEVAEIMGKTYRKGKPLNEIIAGVTDKNVQEYLKGLVKSEDEFKPSAMYETYGEYLESIKDYILEDPQRIFDLAYAGSNNKPFMGFLTQQQIEDVAGNLSLAESKGKKSKVDEVTQKLIDDVASDTLSGIEDYIKPKESKRQEELRQSAEEYQKQYDNVEGIAAALQASGKTITYGDLTADGSNLITLKQILDMQREERDAEINEKYDKEVAEGIAEAMRASGASAIDVARVAYGEDTSGAVPQADVSKFENAIAEADRAFNAGEISEYESDVAKYNALVGERDALLNSGDLKFLGKKLEDAQEVYKQALEAYEQENSDENAKALQEAAQALNDISDEYEGAYDTMLGSIDDALQDLENKSYQEENENAGFERAKVEYGSRGSFSAYEGSSLGESQIDIRIEKNTAETVTLLRDTFHWWKQMYEPQAVFA